MGSVTEAIGPTALSQKASRKSVLGSQSCFQNSIPMGIPRPSRGSFPIGKAGKCIRGATDRSSRFFGYMPQHSRRILDEADGQTPRLNRRSCRSWRAKPFCHGCGIMAMPPFLAVRNHKLHHEILSQFLHIKVLKEEARVAVRHDGDAIVQHIRPESPRLRRTIGIDHDRARG